MGASDSVKPSSAVCTADIEQQGQRHHQEPASLHDNNEQEDCLDTKSSAEQQSQQDSSMMTASFAGRRLLVRPASLPNTGKISRGRISRFTNTIITASLYHHLSFDVPRIHILLSWFWTYPMSSVGLFHESRMPRS